MLSYRIGGFVLKHFYRINEHILAQELRVIGSDGTQLGILTKIDALAKAKELGLDLIEVASQASPPVARIVNFQKFRYEEGKKEKAAKKSSGGGIKELWLSPRIAQHDLEVRLRRAEEFLKDGNKVKLTVKFKGREMGHPELGHGVINKVLDYFGERVMIEREAKFEGRKLGIIIAKAKAQAKESNNEAKDA